MVGRQLNHQVSVGASQNPQVGSIQFSSVALTLQLTTVSMIPLLAAPAHEWSTMLTILMQAQKITAVVMGENQKTVVAFDLQLYEKAVKLQMHKAQT